MLLILGIALQLQFEPLVPIVQKYLGMLCNSGFDFYRLEGHVPVSLCCSKVSYITTLLQAGLNNLQDIVTSVFSGTISYM